MSDWLTENTLLVASVVGHSVSMNLAVVPGQVKQLQADISKELEEASDEAAELEVLRAKDCLQACQTPHTRTLHR